MLPLGNPKRVAWRRCRMLSVAAGGCSWWFFSGGSGRWRQPIGLWVKPIWKDIKVNIKWVFMAWSFSSNSGRKSTLRKYQQLPLFLVTVTFSHPSILGIQPLVFGGCINAALSAGPGWGLGRSGQISTIKFLQKNVFGNQWGESLPTFLRLRISWQISFEFSGKLWLVKFHTTYLGYYAHVLGYGTPFLFLGYLWPHTSVQWALLLMATSLELLCWWVTVPTLKTEQKLQFKNYFPVGKASLWFQILPF